MDWWRDPLGELVRGRRVILAGGPAATWTTFVAPLRELGAGGILVVATDGLGAGPQPDAEVVAVDIPGDPTPMERIRRTLATLADPPTSIVTAVEGFDPDHTAVVFGTFLTESATLVGRELVAHRRPEWVALEDKTTVDALLDRAGVARAPSATLDIPDAVRSWRRFDAGSGTVWAVDARDGFHGGGAGTRWVTDEDEADAVAGELALMGERVRVMPFLEGVATSIHGIVLPDGIAALRPVEMVTLRRGHELHYTGCATFWDPPDEIREEMRDAARRVGERLRADVDFRGAFTLDGVATAGGFRPTELNPRFGAGLAVITRGLGDTPLQLVLDLVVAGIPLGISAADLEREIVQGADAARSGGTWKLHVDTPVEVAGRDASYVDGAWRWSVDGEPVDATIVARGGFMRALFEADRTPVGVSVGQRSADFWLFADAELDAGIGPLTAALDVTASVPQRSSTRP
jgi:hypothetical protein